MPTLPCLYMTYNKPMLFIFLLTPTKLIMTPFISSYFLTKSWTERVISQQEISGWKHKRLQNNSKTVPDKVSKSKTISEIWLSETPTTMKRTNFVTT